MAEALEDTAPEPSGISDTQFRTCLYGEAKENKDGL